MERTKNWLVLSNLVNLAALIAIPLSIIAIIQACNANNIARSVFPSVTITSAWSFPIRVAQPEGYVTTVCRTNIRISNTGGSATSIIGLEPLGDFRSGYLPTLGLRNVYLDFNNMRLLRLLGTRLPIPLGVTFGDESFRGPIPFQTAIVEAGEPGLSPNISTVSAELRSESQVLDLPGLLRELANQSEAGRRIVNEIEHQVPVFEAIGLPFYLAENSVRDVFIDFRYTVPETFSLQQSDVQLTMERAGIDPNVGYRLRFPDIPPVEISRAPCGSGGIDISYR